MNSLPPYPFQHAFKASNKLLSASRTSKTTNGPDFRTNNPDIFPSLSPFSNFYKNKKHNEANAPSRRCPDSLEPVKKYKLNNGNCKVVSQENEISHETTPIPILPKVVAEKDIFRVPRLPKRLCEQNQAPGGSEVAPIGGLITSSVLGLTDSQGSFAVKENFMQDSKAKQEESLSDLPVLAQPSDKSDIEAVKNADQEISKKDQSGIAYPVMDTSFLNGLYEKLKLEYLLLQYDEQVHSLGENVQNSKEKRPKDEINFDDLVVLK